MSTDRALAHSLREAAAALAGVAAGRSLSELLADANRADAPARGALIDLTHGTLRRYGRVHHIVRALSRQAAGDPRVHALLWCSIYALDSGRYAPYTVVDQAVRACALLGKAGAKGYVNALLRAYMREKDALEAAMQENEEARWWHPQWWIDAVRSAYPEAWTSVLAASVTHPPMCLRVNLRRTSLEDYRRRLEDAGLSARPLSARALLLERPVPVERLPGFDAGEVSVQDFGAQRAAALMDLRDGQRVLDACAAPGGKSAHILELADVDLLALDAEASRSQRIEHTLARLGLVARVRACDCTRLEHWWDGRAFDRILADVPCSASGVARRHPDIKWLRRPGDIPRFAARQGEILDALWRALAAGGKLLYVTCSVFPQENERVIESFMGRVPDARRMPLADDKAASWLPGPEHDGFFFALINKQA